MHQETLDFDVPEAAPEREKTIDERFADFDRAHPEVYREFRRLAEQVRAAGHQHYGAKGIFEVLRFHRAVDGRPDEPFKLNNVYTSRYVRKLLAEDSSFEGFFELRELKSRAT